MTDPLIGLLERSRQLGFLGPGPIEAHIAHALAFASVVPADPARALDLGAGGGLPGLVLAVRCWPGARWTFLDANVRRTEFLREAVVELGLSERVVVITERAEVVGRDPEHRGGHDLVVARSFASPGVTAECAAPLLSPSGRLVVSEPPATEVDVRWPAGPLTELGLGPAAAEAVPLPDGSVVHLATLLLTSPAPDRYPRRVGIPAKRPLF